MQGVGSLQDSSHHLTLARHNQDLYSNHTKEVSHPRITVVAIMEGMSRHKTSSTRTLALRTKPRIRDSFPLLIRTTIE